MAQCKIPWTNAHPLAREKTTLGNWLFPRSGERGKKEILPQLLGRVSWLEAVPKVCHWQRLDLN